MQIKLLWKREMTEKGALKRAYSQNYRISLAIPKDVWRKPLYIYFPLF